MSNKTSKLAGLAALLIATAGLSALDAGAGQQDLRLQTKPGAVKQHQIKPQLKAAPQPKGEEIGCPHYNVKVEMITPLPQAWWYTPATKALHTVKVMTVAGKTTLGCVYGNPGQRQPTLMRHPPAGKPNCIANKAQKKFVCTSIK